MPIDLIIPVNYSFKEQPVLSAFPCTHRAPAHQFDGFPPQLPLVPLVRPVNVALHWVELGLRAAVVHDNGLCRM